MTNKGFLQGMEILGEFYDKFSAVLESEKKVALWRKILSKLSDEEFKGAVLYHVQTSRFAPSVADIIDAAKKIAESTELTAEEAWGIVYSDISRYGYYQEPEYEEWMMEAAKNAIGWSTLCDLTADTLMATRAHFLRIYNSLRERKRSVELCGSAAVQTKQVLSTIVEKLAVNAGAKLPQLEGRE